MNWKELYEINRNRKIQVIEEIQGDFTIKSSIKHFLKRHPYGILVSFSIIILLCLFAFYQTPKAMISTFLLLGSILFFSILFHSFSIIGKKNEIIVKTNGQELIIPYNKLKHLYIEESYFRIFFKKYYQYSLILLYESSAHNICDVSFSTSLLQEQEIEEVLRQVKVKSCPINYQKECIDHRRKRLLKKVILFILLSLIVFFLSLLT